MTSVLSAVSDWVALHPWAAYGAVFLFALSESIPIVGAVVPGTAVILAIAALVPSGAIGLWPLLCAAVVGAILSDGVAYRLGRRYHREITGCWPLNRYPGVLARSETFFLRHGGKSVFLARFMPGVRAFVPLTAGMLGMPAARFYAANVVSACAWAVTNVLPGVAIGDYVHVGDAAVGRFAVPALVVAGLAWMVVALGRHALRRRTMSLQVEGRTCPVKVR